MSQTMPLSLARIVTASLLLLIAHVAQSQEPASVSDETNGAQVLFSGHSLIDNPLPEWVELIARSQGKKIAWEEQIVIGSPVRVRTRGDNSQSSGWDGYRYGKNRNSDGMNIIEELRNPTHIRTRQPYDTLVLAEINGSLSAVIWENSIGYLRHFHDRLLDGNLQGRTLYVHTWMPIENAHVPAWVEHEKGASTVWQCVVEKVKLTLQAEDRPARLSIVPAGLALAVLVEKAIEGKLETIRGTTQQKLDEIFRDNVHLTDPGIYFIAAVHYSAIYRQSPEGAAAPPTVPGALAKELQAVAWEVTRDFMKKATAQPLTMPECRRVIVERVCQTYWSLNKAHSEINRCQSFFAQSHANAEGSPFVWPDPNWTPLPKP